MAENSLATAVCQIAIAFRDRSLQQAVAESGYSGKPGELSVDAVAQVLRQNPELVDQWFCYCEDKRTSWGWYIIEEGGGFVVGKIDGQKLDFSDRIVACPEFVVREIGEVTRPK